MKLSRRTNTIILWLISLALLVGMVIMFTPSLGNIGQLGQDMQEPVALRVNDEPITEVQVARAQQSPLYQSVRTGEVGEDLELLLLDSLIDREVLRQAAARINVSNGDVRQAVDDFRRANGVAGRDSDNRYLALIGNAGYDDQSFRAALREQLRVQRFQEELTADVTVDDAEVEAYFGVNDQNYATDARIEARMITVDDAELAADLLGHLEAGADFADLAAESSVERADRGGALGAADGESEPRPVGRAALPTAVANAAFALEGPGRTGVVESGGRAYIVEVERFLEPEVQPLDAVRERVEADAREAKRQAVLEREIERLRDDATVVVPEESNFQFEDRVIATVGEAEILRTDLVRATYTNPQIQQALSPQTADLIAGFFKSSTLAQLIDIELAYQGAQDLAPDFIGSKRLVAQQAFDWVTREADATEDEIVAYYESNPARYTVPASADATRVDFDAEVDAVAFRAALLEGQSVDDAAAAVGGEVQDLGTVAPGQLDGEIDTALFGTEAFTDLPDAAEAISDVLVLDQPVEAPAGSEAGEADADGASEPGDAGVDQAEPGTEEAQQVERVYVVLVADRTPETVRPLSDVRDQVEQAVLTQERAELREAWLSELAEEIEVVNLEAADASGDEGAAAPDGDAGDAASETDAEAGSDGSDGNGGGEADATDDTN